MKTTEVKKVSLVRDSMYSIGLYVTILLGQLYIIIKHNLPLTPIFIGPIYLPSLINGILVLLLLVVTVLTMKQHRNREKSDELADFNHYKAGYITKYICIFVFTIIILLANYFKWTLKDDTVGNVLSVFVISLSFTEMIHNIVFVILEKK